MCFSIIFDWSFGDLWGAQWTAFPSTASALVPFSLGAFSIGPAWLEDCTNYVGEKLWVLGWGWTSWRGWQCGIQHVWVVGRSHCDPHMGLNRKWGRVDTAVAVGPRLLLSPFCHQTVSLTVQIPSVFMVTWEMGLLCSGLEVCGSHGHLFGLKGSLLALVTFKVI